MAKKIVTDIIPPNKRSIRRVSLSPDGDRRPSQTGRRQTQNKNAQQTHLRSEELRRGKAKSDKSILHEPLRALPPRRKKKPLWGWIAGVVALVLIVFGVLSLFDGATVAVTPRSEQVVINHQFTAGGEEGIAFETMTLSHIASRTVAANGEKQVDTKASGTITIFNNFSSASQRLIKNTRFETPDGLIYKIDRSVVVPGQTENENGEVVPGSIDVTVFAETSGEEYNIGRTEFTIPGFKENDDPRFFKFHAKSETAMSGGFSGLAKTVAPEDEAQARTDMREEIRELLLREARTQTPEGFVLYDDGLFISFSSLPSADTQDQDTAQLQEQGVLHAFLLDEGEFARAVALETIQEYEGEPVHIDTQTQDVVFTVSEKETIIDPTQVDTFSFTFEGDMTLIWEFDQEQLRDDLAGKHTRDRDSIFSQFGAIETADITLRPFWKRTFPEEGEKITIEINNEILPK